jgi:SAM-dependent methyltransferase
MGAEVTYSTLGGAHHSIEDMVVAGAIPNLMCLSPGTNRNAPYDRLVCHPKPSMPLSIVNHRYSCQVCETPALENVAGYSDLPRVTSDSRPWPIGGVLTVCRKCGAIQKLPTSEWIDETKKIYANYDLWPLADGAEQPIFLKSGAIQPRSTLLVDFLKQEAALRSHGSLLDIGCGTGAAIANFAKAFPGWRLNGADLTERALPRLKEVPGFDQLFTDPLGAIKGEFDLVSMIHSLEHFSNPHEGLNAARALLSAEGRVFVEVPNAAVNPFDLLVADHLLHFTPTHLRQLALRAGLNVLAIRDDVLPKEIAMLAKHTNNSVNSNFGSNGEQWFAYTAACVVWLKTLLSEARKCANQAKRAGHQFGIFGTSISGMWLYGALRDTVDFFVDEDVSRQGCSWECKTIYSPDAVLPNASVYVPLVPIVAAEVAQRLNCRNASYTASPLLNEVVIR